MIEHCLLVNGFKANAKVGDGFNAATGVLLELYYSARLDHSHCCMHRLGEAACGCADG